MKIKSLTLHGFKSFADRTQIDFHGGITAIVGPNGCGKSNISDSLRWVLGEQRPTAIRGSRMEEAIFQGTAQRRPIHRAEVALTLANEDGLLAVPYNEVVIGRTVLRGGDSDYQLNGASCRLRDIHDLCRDTGLGANAYSIIEARMIDAILSDRAEERRSLFEEAAEVGRYKDRRRTALRRLDQAQHDLARLEDVLGEVRTQVRALGRQRGRARRYEELRERRLRLEIAVADERLRATEARLGEAEAALEELRRQQPEVEAHLQQRETEAENLRLGLVERERRRSEVSGELERIRARSEELERERLLSGERASAARARLEVVRSEIATVGERRAGLGEQIEDLAGRIETGAGEQKTRARDCEAFEQQVRDLRERRLEVERGEQEALAEVARVIREAGSLEAESEAIRERSREWARELDRRRTGLEAMREAVTAAGGRVESLAVTAREAERRHAELEGRVEEDRNRVQELREELRASQDRVGALEAELSSLSAVASGLGSILAEGRDLPPVVSDLLSELGSGEGVAGVLADAVDAPRDVRAAVEAHLGPLLHAVVVRDWKSVRVVQSWLAGRGSEEGLVVLPVDPGPRRPPSSDDQGLSRRVTLQGAGEAWARALLEDVELAEPGSLAPRAGAWVAVDGSGQDDRGVVRLGRPVAGAGVLRRRGELAELAERRTGLADELDSARADLQRLEASASEAGTALAERERQLAEATDLKRRSEAERDTAIGQLERSGAQVEELEIRIGELEMRLAQSEAGLPDEDARRAALEETRAAAEDRLTAVRAGLTAATEEWEQQNAALQDVRLDLARREAEVGALRERQQVADRADGDLEDRLSELQGEQESRLAAIAESEAAIEGSENELLTLLERRHELAGSVREAQEGLEERRSELERRETELRAERQHEREVAERRHSLELEVTQLQANRSSIRERLEAEWETGFEELRDRVEELESGEPSEWATELESIRNRLSSIGPVNLLAAKEWEEEKRRLDFLEEQRTDLEKARDDLHDSIRRINDAAASAFSRVFGEVRENFRRIFVTLFEGGEADVWLEDPDDPLDSPIEISASPRGKRTQRIHLLSGGERALTALALLFAIYLTKPSPFCVMDEVDAPLDETNIGRFTAMLERFKDDTQFIVITHNARTIEAADWIYGVTMQEPGVSTLVGVELQDLPRGQVA